MNPYINKVLKGFLPVFLAFVFIFSHSSISFAAQSAEQAAEEFKVEEKKHGPYKDKNPHYEDIDVINYEEMQAIKSDKDDDKKGFTLNPFTAVSNYFSDTADDAMGSVKDTTVSIFLMMVQLIFQINIMLTDFMLTCLDASMNSSIINYLIDVSEKQVQAIAGIENNQVITGKGIFGQMAALAGLISIAYMVYLFAIKRAPIESLKSVVQPLLAIFFSIVLISNFGTVLKGVNNVTNDLTNGISASTKDGDVDTMGDSIQKVFIHRPWMYLQFGSDNEEKIGKKRIEALLLNDQTKKEKRAAIKKEVKDYKNTMLEPGSVVKRLAYVFLFITVNGLLSIPVWALSFVFIGLQWWFLLIAVLAPFILIWSILPNQFTVVRRYGIELCYPMGLKVIIGFLALVVFTVSDLIFSIPAMGGLTGYYISTFLQGTLFFILFFMRKRIKAIFSATNGIVGEMRQSTQIAMQPVKEGIQNTATLVGAGVGAATGSPQATAIGASVGRSIGKTVTGEQDATSTMGQLVWLNAANNQGDNQSNTTKTSSKATNKEGKQQFGDVIQLHDLKEKKGNASSSNNNEDNSVQQPVQEAEKQTKGTNSPSHTGELHDVKETVPVQETNVSSKEQQPSKEKQSGTVQPTNDLHDLNEMDKGNTKKRVSYKMTPKQKADQHPEPYKNEEISASLEGEQPPSSLKANYSTSVESQKMEDLQETPEQEYQQIESVDEEVKEASKRKAK